jgi:NADH-quinone oxidoreductase subunit E
MTNRTDESTSTAVVWGIAALTGVVGAAVAIVAMGLGFMAALFLGVIVAILVGLVMTIAFRRGQAAAPTPGPETAARASVPEPTPTLEPVVQQPVAAPAPAAEPAGQNPATAAEPVAGQRPAPLAAPRGDAPDDLKRIKGVGPKLEQMLHGMGIYHFDQIAAWTAAELAWVDDNLTGFKGRASRDDWQAQAKLLAEGGETEFSARVGKGEVY